MTRAVLVSLCAVVTGCSPSMTADGGSAGGSAAGGSSGGTVSAGGSAGGASSAGGSAGGTSSPLPDGGAGTINGPTAFPISAARTVIGANGSLVFTALYNAQPVSCSMSPNPPFSIVSVRVRNTDGGVVTPGTWPIDGVNVKVSRDDFLTNGQGPDGGEALSGSVVLTRLEPGRSSGTFTAAMQFYNLTSGTISGTWDAPVCP